MVDDPSLGSAVNTSLDENQFEHVGTDIMTGAVSPSAFAASTQKAVPAAPKFGPR
jgi:hypothetical protein